MHSNPRKCWIYSIQSPLWNSFFFWFFKWISSNFQNNRLFFFCSSIFANNHNPNQIDCSQIGSNNHTPKVSFILCVHFFFVSFYFIFCSSLLLMFYWLLAVLMLKFTTSTHAHQTIDQTFSIVINHLMVRLHQAMSITYILKHCCTRKAHKMQFNSTKSIHWIQFQLGIHFCRFSHCTSKIHIYF